MPEDLITTFYTTDFTINLASALSCKCGISECPMESAPCPFGYTGRNSEECMKVAPSMWVDMLMRRTR
jgi:hypothetical protein